ncbi:putative E3 ubiquitin-protein ligase HECTD2 [Trichonephila inaurata madagascariensis]|uniref:Putative E3 ubiquitin-protein ligase HECTD2 n=1 Tax=Trichonephila inaurata madagascariensis TaxID=2747483 RepID=A0A8X6YWI9_9ARAC|nr:putative E3 ubiquitin-protein ligase HECTD2 [Trichonephila inaurata madagascariensis]
MASFATYDKEFCDYVRFQRNLLLRSLIPSEIPQEIIDELQDTLKPAYFGIESVTVAFSNYIFYDEFLKVFEECAEMYDSSEIECAQFLLSRCIRLCDEPEPTYLNFLLVAAFLRESVLQFFHVYQCYRILYICDFCLDVLYNRLFRKVFESREVYEKLELFCKEFLEHFTEDTTQGEFQDSTFGKHCVHFVEERFCVKNDSLFLTESEVELFETFYSVESTEKDEEWCILPETENAESSYFDAKEHYPSDCMACGSKCSYYLNYVNLFPLNLVLFSQDDSGSRQIVQVTGFGPLITDTLGVIHTYITGLLLPPSSPESPPVYVSLPPISQGGEGQLVTLRGEPRQQAYVAPPGARSPLLSPAASKTPLLEDLEPTLILYPTKETSLRQLR